MKVTNIWKELTILKNGCSQTADATFYGTFYEGDYNA